MNHNVLCLVGTALAFIFRISNAQSDIDVVECEPELADSCFTNVPQILKCITSRDKGSDCNKKTISDFCSEIDEALACTSDTINGNCNEQQGRDRFNLWLRGLRAVYYSLCGSDRTGLLAFTGNPTCWSLPSFISCTKNRAGIDHVNDLLKTKLDLNECNRLLVSISMCNVMATSTSSARCSPLLDVVSEMVHTFFTATGCGQACSSAPRGLNTSLPILLVICAVHLLVKCLVKSHPIVL